MLSFCCELAWDAVCTEAALDVCGAFREATFQLLNGVTLQGGYAGLGAADPDERDPAEHESVLSGDLIGNDGPGLFENNQENSLHVVTGSATDATAVLDGFTITAGHADGPGWPQLGAAGAGILNDTGSPTVNQCVITGNFALPPIPSTLNFSVFVKSGGKISRISARSASFCWCFGFVK